MSADFTEDEGKRTMTLALTVAEAASLADKLAGSIQQQNFCHIPNCPCNPGNPECIYQQRLEIHLTSLMISRLFCVCSAALGRPFGIPYAGLSPEVYKSLTMFLGTDQ